MPGYELIGAEEQKALEKIFTESGGVLFAHGLHDRRNGIYHVRSFESEFAKKFGAQHATAVTSGTAAIKVALKALGVGPGHEVITQSFTFIATIEAILDVGAKPVIVDIDDSLNMCVKDLKKKITSRTKAILPVPMLGFSTNIETICNIAKENNLYVVEENCEALGARYKNRPLGVWGDIAVYSLDFGKVITCGEGGMILTNNDKFGKYIREYIDHGHENNKLLPRGRDSRSIAGFNFRMTEMQAAVGRAQLEKLDFILTQNKLRYEALDAALDSSFVRRHMYENSTPIFDTYIFRVSDSVMREQLIKTLQQEKFGTKNMPDALEWHFAGYWDHIFNASELAEINLSKARLHEYVSVPILLARSVEDYKQLGLSLSRVTR